MTAFHATNNRYSTQCSHQFNHARRRLSLQTLLLRLNRSLTMLILFYTLIHSQMSLLHVFRENGRAIQLLLIVISNPGRYFRLLTRSAATTE